MNTFNKKSLFVALASLGALSVTGTADAVYVNPDGTGQVLLYPYYTVRNKIAGAAPFNSLLSVVNSTASAKIVKVRFLEGKNSREVLDFNLYLSAKDVWTTAIVPVGAGAGIITSDNSCTTPTVSSDGANPTPFVNFAYTGGKDDLAGGGLDRTSEGYVEIIEMGNLGKGTSTEGYITHSGLGVPDDCSAINSTQSSDDLRPGNGGLFGGMTLINVLAGEDITADAVALADFSSKTNWAIPGSILPDLTKADPEWTVFARGGARFGSTTLGIDSVSAVLMHANVLNEFVLDAGTLSQTSWVVTFPTKRYYYDPVITKECGSSKTPCLEVQGLFQKNFNASGACDELGLVAWSREEQKPSSPGGFSPPRPDSAKPQLCWEANIISFNGKDVFGSANVSNVTTAYSAGWMDLDLDAGGSTATSPYHILETDGGTFVGLPVIGFAAQTFNNGTLTDVTGKLIQSQYGGNFVHKYTSGIQSNQ